MAAHRDFRTHEDDLGTLYAKYKSVYQLLGAGVLVLIGAWIGATLFADDSGYATNLYTEIISIGVTIAIIDQLNRQRDKRDLKSRLILQAGNVSHSVAIEALDRIKLEGWLTGDDGILQNMNLRDARWQNASIREANLIRSSLVSANLSGIDLLKGRLSRASLDSANLSGAMLFQAKFVRTSLYNADLSGANLWGADLTGAYLISANLAGAQLVAARLWDTELAGANLAGAHLDDCEFNENTVLPDANELSEDDYGKLTYDKYWTPDTDMTRYTDPNHPDFWEPEWVKEARAKGDGG